MDCGSNRIMQAPDGLLVGEIRTITEVMFANPFISWTTKENVCEAPVPDDGVTPTVLTGVAAPGAPPPPPGTVHDPRKSQPAAAPFASRAYNQIDFEPPNVAPNAMGRVSESDWPVVKTDAPVDAMLH